MQIVHCEEVASDPKEDCPCTSGQMQALTRFSAVLADCMQMDLATMKMTTPDQRMVTGFIK